MMKERLEQLMELLNLTPTQFANAIGVQRATLQHILSGRNEPSLKIIMAIHNSFPDVELEWLLNGKGTAIPGLQQKSEPAQDYPLLPGMESAFFPADLPGNQKFSNLSDQEGPSKNRKKRNNKDVRATPDAPNTSQSKVIKEVVVFFEDGTYQKFS
ncbi:MAG: helix-turn-helix transcriptional regulator [Bacteroidaceae bacterium]|jgi:DNA-binding XRE family transcriptional regulator|nr:helix-turn-helix transcriptional regulator [Bacteroidaceae bacterium]